MPTIGDRVTVTVRTGYRLAQDRPFDCRYACHCGECNGRVTEHPGTVARLIAWMDNSTDAVVLCDDGETRTMQLEAPHGDLCY